LDNAGPNIPKSKLIVSSLALHLLKTAVVLAQVALSVVSQSRYLI
jgi:hypothetical protein